MKKLGSIFGIVKMAIKYAPLIMVAVKALEMIQDAYNDLQAGKDLKELK